MTKFNPSYLVRKATLSDVMFFYEAIVSTAGLTLNENDFSAIYKAKLKIKSNQLLILLDTHGDIAGCTVIEHRAALIEDFPFFEIQFFFIKPKYRKHHAAEVLYHEIEKVAIEKKCFKIIVSSLLSATINQRFYTKKGFKLIKKTFLKTLL